MKDNAWVTIGETLKAAGYAPNFTGVHIEVEGVKQDLENVLAEHHTGLVVSGDSQPLKIRRQHLPNAPDPDWTT